MIDATDELPSALRQRFGDAIGPRLGHGGEATVYALAGDRVLRVYNAQHATNPALVAFYEQLAQQDLGFATPRILEHGEIDTVSYTVDRRIAGSALMDVLPDLRGERRRIVLDAYIDAADRVRELRIEQPSRGEFLREPSIARPTWREYLRDRAAASLEEGGRTDLMRAVPELDRALVRLDALIDAYPEPVPVLVHGDYFPGNVMVDDKLRVTGVIDFGPLTVMGDAAMDLAGGAIFLEVARGFEPDDVTYVVDRLQQRHGDAILHAVEMYRLWYAVRFSPYKADDGKLFAWCVASLAAARV